MNDFEMLNRFLDKYVNVDEDQPAAWAALDRIEAEVERLTAEANKSWEELRKSDAEVEGLRKMADDSSVEAFETREMLRESGAEVERLRAALERAANRLVARNPVDAEIVTELRDALAEEKE